MHRQSSVMSAVCSNSSITGALVSKAWRTDVVVEAELGQAHADRVGLMPTRCSAELAFGDE